MNYINALFFELIRVAIGTQETFSRLPSEVEWEELFEMAVKQSLVGVCFCGIHQLGADSDGGYINIGMSEDLYFDWMGMAAKINMKNDLVNEQCVELQKRLSAEGLRSCVLKGQGVATLYGEELRGFRQSGDIDIFVEGGRKAVLDWVNKIEPDAEWDYVHTHLHFFADTEVEVHYRFGELYNLNKNRKLQKWFDNNRSYCDCELSNSCVISVPAPQFNALYLLLHIYRHLFAGGIGLRQIMDYYYFLEKSRSNIDVEKLHKEIDIFGMRRFCNAMMWVTVEVFGMNESSAICELDPIEGQYLLASIMEGGNFGHTRRKTFATTRAGKLFRMLRASLHLSTHYGQEALWTPIWHIYHFFWKRTSGRIK